MKNFLLRLIAFFIISPVGAYTLPQLKSAVDHAVADYGRQHRERSLQQLLEGVQKSQRVTKQLKEDLTTVISEDLSVYTDERTDRLRPQDLNTDTSIRSLPFEKILSGGPGKDGIPALSNPKFVSYDDALESGSVRPEGEGIVVTASEGSSPRFYPFSILNRHEIVNDTIESVPIMVTYCPLCGTAIAYERQIDDQVLEFGVSGLLFQSNLLMYDDATESLWSQAFGRGKVGVYTDYELTYYPSQLMSARQYHELYPDGVVLSSETGYIRDYTLGTPYGDYAESDDLIFPVDEFGTQLPPKTLMVVVHDERGFSAAFDRKALMRLGTASIRIDDRVTLTAIVEQDSIIVIEDGHNILPHFSEMWFSWSARNRGSEMWWSSEI